LRVLRDPAKGGLLPLFLWKSLYVTPDNGQLVVQVLLVAQVQQVSFPDNKSSDQREHRVIEGHRVYSTFGTCFEKADEQQGGGIILRCRQGCQLFKPYIYNVTVFKIIAQIRWKQEAAKWTPRG